MVAGVVPLALLLAECEASRHPLSLDQLSSGAAAQLSSPALPIQQAIRQLQQRTFKQIMLAKYALPPKASAATMFLVPQQQQPVMAMETEP